MLVCGWALAQSLTTFPPKTGDGQPALFSTFFKLHKAYEKDFYAILDKINNTKRSSAKVTPVGLINKFF